LRSIRPLGLSAAVVFFVVSLLGGTSPAQVPAEHVIYSFCDKYPSCPHGAFPYAGLIMDPSGNFLYGTTYKGGGGLGCNGIGCGTVFLLHLTETGWKQRVLHGFASFANDGLFPVAAVVLDKAGNLYGTTWGGGNTSSQCTGFGSCGTVFELSPGPNEWIENVLYDFCSQANCKDGADPVASLILDAAGNLYGTTATGGISSGKCRDGCGTVFELVREPNGWSEKVLFRFTYDQGANPEANLTFDDAGNLYGTTIYGGANGIGTVFKLTPGSNGKWTETVLHSFNTVDGRGPVAGVILDAAGNLYGTTYLGGTGAGCLYSYGCGTVFELSPNSDGSSWNEQVLYSFCSQTNCTDGANPSGSLVSAGAGVMYGSTYQGGLGIGVVFKLTLSTTWSESSVYALGSNSAVNDAMNPEGALIVDAQGKLFGTGEYGGNSTNCNNNSSCGAVFVVNPK
jgi:uncharacterized repeat protein (TIGR03803 family)